MAEEQAGGVRPAVSALARACLEALRQAGGEEPEHAAELVSDGCWGVLLAVFPAPAADKLAGLKACDLDCLALLARLVDPIPAEAMRDELESSGTGIYSIATVKRALGRLLALGFVGNNKRKPQGYYLKFRPLPLERFLAQPDTPTSAAG